MKMKIICPHCQGKAVISNTHRVSEKIVEHYVDCRNFDCGARTVFRTFYSHDITPPAETLTNALHEILANLPAAERASLLKQYAPPLYSQPALF